MKKIILIFSLSIMISISYSIEMTNQGILFSYEDENAQSVFLVGSMNGWDVSAMPMAKNDNGIWVITLKLSPGKYTYKFIAVCLERI